MSTWAIAVAGGLYLMTAFDQQMQGNVGLALTFLCYALANVGLILATMKI